MKRAVVTRADDNIKQMCELTHPSIRAYAEKCGADFIIYDHESPVMTGDNRPHYRIIKGAETLEEYDRILFIDSDVLVNPKCPDVFEVVPEDCIGTIYEDKGSRRKMRRRLIREMQEKWGDVGWTEGYTNAGVFVVSRCHAGIFEPHNGEYWLEWGSADLHMSYMARKNGYKFFELPFTWNHMTMFSEGWNGSPDRFESNMIHYAGKGAFDGLPRLEQIRADVKRMKEAKMRVFFLVGSGIGNQVETVPAFNLVKKKYEDVVVVNTEPYNIEATKVIFKNLAPVYHFEDKGAAKAHLAVGTYFCYKSLPEIKKASTERPVAGQSETEFNMVATGLPYEDADFGDCGGCLDYIEANEAAPDVVIHDGYNKKHCGRMGKEKWMAKSYLHWARVAELLKERGYRVGSIGSEDEHVPGTEDYTGLELEDSLAVLKGSQVVLCNDTGTFHLCNLIGKENIVVFTFTEDNKNFDERFHRHSTLVRSDVECSPCQGKGRHYWYFNKPNCKWKCREGVRPAHLVDLAVSKMRSIDMEKYPVVNKVISNEDTIADLRERFVSDKPFTYLRFGDADLYFINDPMFDKNRRHDGTFGMSAELERAFSIENPDYLIGCAAGGKVFSNDRKLRDIAEKHHQGKVFHSAVALQILYTEDPEGFVSFCKECFWGKKVLIIGGESVAINPLVQKAFGVTASIKLSDRNAYAMLDSKMEHIEKNIPHFDIVVSALGQATRVLGHRIWSLGYRTKYFDVGSVVDALAGRDLRSWIKRVPELREKYEQAFMG